MSTKNIIEGERKNKGKNNTDYLINDPQYANILNKLISKKIAEQDAKQEKKDDEEEKKKLESFVPTQADKNFVVGNDLSSDDEYQPSTEDGSDYDSDDNDADESVGDHDNDSLSDHNLNYNKDNDRNKQEYEDTMTWTEQESSNNKREEGAATNHADKKNVYKPENFTAAPYRHAEWNW